MNKILLAVLSLLLVAQTTVPSQDAKIPVPKKDEQAQARKVVQEVYSPNQAKTNEEKQQLAQKMLQVASETANKIDKYVLLDTVISLNDAETTFKAIEELEAYRVDILKIKADAVIRVKGDNLDSVLEEAIVADRYDVAKQLVEQLIINARKTRDAHAYKAALVKQKEVAGIEYEYLKSKKSVTQLAKNPDDPKARLDVGRFYCYVKGEWDKGLPFLASCSDENIKNLARIEIEKPSYYPFQVSLADGWWELSKKETGLISRRIHDHAVMWYKKSLPLLKGLEKARVEKRLVEKEEEDHAATPPRKELDRLVSLTTNIDSINRIDSSQYGIKGKFERRGQIFVVNELYGMRDVFSVHPISKSKPAIINFSRLPRFGTIRVHFHSFGSGECKVVLKANGEILKTISTKSDGWKTIEAPLSQSIIIEVHDVQWYFDITFVSYELIRN